MIAFQNKDVGERFIHTIMMHGRYSRHRFGESISSNFAIRSLGGGEYNYYGALYLS